MQSQKQNAKYAELPTGIYYENSRRRFRVRLYKNGNVVFREYFKTLGEAKEALTHAKKIQNKTENPSVESINGLTIESILESL